MWLAFWWYSFYCCSLKSNRQYLWGVGCVCVCIFLKLLASRDFPGSLLGCTAGTHVQSLVKGLRSYIPHGVPKKKLWTTSIQSLLICRASPSMWVFMEGKVYYPELEKSNVPIQGFESSWDVPKARMFQRHGQLAANLVVATWAADS